jgi:hypothetical protein
MLAPSLSTAVTATSTTAAATSQHVLLSMGMPVALLRRSRSTFLFHALMDSHTAQTTDSFFFSAETNKSYTTHMWRY